MVARSSIYSNQNPIKSNWWAPEKLAIAGIFSQGVELVDQLQARILAIQQQKEKAIALY